MGEQSEGSSKPRQASLFARIGGDDAIQSAVVDFYARVMCDPRLEPFFDGLDMSAQIQKQIAFMTMAFGGPHTYTGRALAQAHASSLERGMTDEHVDLVIGHLRDTLREIGVDDTTAHEVLAHVEGLRDEVMGRD